MATTSSYRSVAKVSVSLGLFGFPVSVYKATEEPTSGISFKILHDKCSAPINRKDSCSSCGEAVTSANSVKGFAEADGSYTILTDAEVKAVKPEAAGSLAITGYMPQIEMDPSYLDGDVYYLSPDRGDKGKGDTATFVTFRDALGDRFAIGSVVMYGREHIVAIRAFQNVLAMHFVRTHAEVRDIARIPGVDSIPTTAQADYVAMMAQVMDAKAISFPEVALESDSYADALKALIEAKRAGRPVVAEAPSPRQMATDLQAMLLASLAQARQAA